MASGPRYHVNSDGLIDQVNEYVGKRTNLLLVAATSGTSALNAPPRFCVPAGISAVLVSFPAKRRRRV
jgi:hypothetical protein